MVGWLFVAALVMLGIIYKFSLRFEVASSGRKIDTKHIDALSEVHLFECKRRGIKNDRMRMIQCLISDDADRLLRDLRNDLEVKQKNVVEFKKRSL